MSKSHYRPTSTAMVVTLIALSLALADSAVAETDTVAKAISTARVKRIARGVANQEISKRAPGLSVGSAVSAQSANTANFASSANPDFFARVGRDGTVDPANSKGVTQTDVTNPQVGFYCFSGPPGVRGGQVTLDFNENLTDNIAQFGLGIDATGRCPDTTTQFFVVIINANAEGGIVANGGFFLHLYQ